MTMEISKLISDRRKELGLTLEEVGKIVGVSKSTVKKWEDGYISNMKRDKIALLAKALKLNPVVLITGEEEPTSTSQLTEDEELQEYLEELKNRSEMRMLFSLAKGATKEDVEKAVKIIEALKEDD